jgi:FkbM family methyltransferase
MITDVEFNDVKFKMCIPPVNLHNSYHAGNVQSEIFHNKVWALDESNIMNKILKQFKGPVIDVGSNTGYFSFIGLINECPVISIEANPIHTEYLEKTIAINNFSNIQHIEKFVSTNKGECNFDGWTGNDKLISNDNNMMVKCISLDELCDECLFLKIDVEGNEPDVIKSAKNLLEQSKIKYIMFEITYLMNDVLDNENIDMLSVLNNYGFTLYEITPGNMNEIIDIKNKVNKWEWEYFNHHKKANPSITDAGSNILAIHNSAVNIFTKNKNGSYHI